MENVDVHAILDWLYDVGGSAYIWVEHAYHSFESWIGGTAIVLTGALSFAGKRYLDYRLQRQKTESDKKLEETKHEHATLLETFRYEQSKKIEELKVSLDAEREELKAVYARIVSFYKTVVDNEFASYKRLSELLDDLHAELPSLKGIVEEYLSARENKGFDLSPGLGLDKLATARFRADSAKSVREVCELRHKQLATRIEVFGSELRPLKPFISEEIYTICASLVDRCDRAAANENLGKSTRLRYCNEGCEGGHRGSHRSHRQGSYIDPLEACTTDLADR